jgi:SAM-dependent methyltransferase
MAEEDFRVQSYLDCGDATGWFDEVYRRANGSEERIPWAHAKPRPEFAQWIRLVNPAGAGKKGLVVACGLGDDAELLTRYGYDVTAFDISSTAIAWCKRRFPHSNVNYTVADMFRPPTDWLNSFDFVLEVFTVQALPIEMRAESIASVAQFVAPGGQLLLICIGVHCPNGRPGPPWPFTREETYFYQQNGLGEIDFAITQRNDASGIERWRILYERKSIR